jgi:hypothetical protein
VEGGFEPVTSALAAAATYVHLDTGQAAAYLLSRPVELALTARLVLDRQLYVLSSDALRKRHGDTP